MVRIFLSKETQIVFRYFTERLYSILVVGVFLLADQGVCYANFDIAKGIQRSELKVREFSVADRAEAIKILESRREFIDSLFRPDIDPYVGIVKKAKVCQLANLPEGKLQDLEGKKSAFRYTRHLFASSGKLMGDCSKPKDLLRVQYELLYCPNAKKLYSLTYYYSQEVGKRSAPLANCR